MSDYEGYVKFAGDEVLSVQCFEGRHRECADVANHAEGGPDFPPALDGYYCECSCPEPTDVDCGLADEEATHA